MLKGLLVLLIFQFLGECITDIFQLPIPGAIIGMLLLFIFLQYRQEPSKELALCGHFLIKHLSLLFLPASVGIFFLGEVFSTHWLPITFAIVVSTALALFITAIVMQFSSRTGLFHVNSAKYDHQKEDK